LCKDEIICNKLQKYLILGAKPHKLLGRASVFTFSPLKRSQNHTVLKKRATATAQKEQEASL
jgi:hypothetical protein